MLAASYTRRLSPCPAGILGPRQGKYRDPVSILDAAKRPHRRLESAEIKKGQDSDLARPSLRRERGQAEEPETGDHNSQEGGKAKYPLEMIPGAKISGIIPGGFWPRYVPVSFGKSPCWAFTVTIPMNRKQIIISFFILIFLIASIN